MDDEHRIAQLEEHAEHLNREKRTTLENLKLVRSLGWTGEDPMDEAALLSQMVRIACRVLPLSHVAVYLLDDAAADFLPALFHPAMSGARLAQEVENLIWDGTFAWALTQDTPHVTRTANGRPMILNTMSSAGNIRGMFVACLACRERDVPDASLPLLSLVLRLCSAMLDDIRGRDRGTPSRNYSRDELERLVMERTRELAQANDRLKAEVAERARVEAHFKTIFDNAVEGIFRIEAGRGFSMANPAMAKLLGYDDPEQLVRSVYDVRNQICVDPQSVSDLLHRLEGTGEVTGFECQVVTRDGRFKWLSLSARVVDRLNGRVTIVEGLASDITGRREREERLSRQANMDEVTGIPNRAHFNATLARMMKQAARSGQGLALLFIDLDHFKRVNDTHGHPIGDDVLRKVAERIQSRVRGSDLAARLGGDEFGVILHDVDSRASCMHVASDLVRAISRDIKAHGTVFKVGASIGIYLYDGGDERPEDLIRKADKAMYRAKNTGRNACYLFGDTVVRSC